MSDLIPHDLLKIIPDLYEIEEIDDPLCYVKLFLPSTAWSWYIIELSKTDHNLCFGYVVGIESELGYFSLQELESLRGSMGLSVERDVGFVPTGLASIKQTVKE